MRKLWDSVLSSSSHYDNFTLHGRFPAAPAPEFVNPFLGVGSAFNLVGENERNKILSLAGDFCFTPSTRKHLDVSVRKMDHKPVRDYLDCPFYQRALAYVDAKFMDALTVNDMTPSEILEDTDLDKACGYFETWRGFRTKGDCVKAGLLFEFEDLDMDEVVLWKVSGKHEIKETDLYLGEWKQRTFIIEPFSMLYHDKRHFGKQNAGMKNCWWSKYGFNPYEGGVHMMATNLCRFKRKWEWDVKGYDRLFPHMRDVQNMRLRHIKDNPRARWVAENKCRSTLVLPNGDIISKDWGNNSGSGTTTGDNIIGMAIPIVHSFLRMGFTEKQIDDLVWCNLFGDDVLGGDNLDISDETFKEGILSTFKLYGFLFDPFIISHTI